MTSEVISLAEKKDLRQTTFRADPELIRKARFLLDREGKSVAQFLVEALEQYVSTHEDTLTQPKSDCA
jgi:predicted DNA-binding protein